MLRLVIALAMPRRPATNAERLSMSAPPSGTRGGVVRRFATRPVQQGISVANRDRHHNDMAPRLWWPQLGAARGGMPWRGHGLEGGLHAFLAATGQAMTRSAVSERRPGRRIPGLPHASNRGFEEHYALVRGYVHHASGVLAQQLLCATPGLLGVVSYRILACSMS
jgi:hypothetical protein